MEHVSIIAYKEGLSFDVEADGHHFSVDADEQFGGRDTGPKPKKLLLSALGGCTGMDVVSILTKMRMPFDKFWLEVTAELDETASPTVYKKFRISYCFTGSALEPEKIEKAVKLSEEKYCGVSAMFRNFADIETEIRYDP